ncbi:MULTISPECIES: TetR/AcrR family transcriptional regulator [Pseudomonas]|uniref:TetR/AcrR family transcriptional regulator n=1 Tax=Pseudomonas TaxID=286 RepID=UPI001CF9981D|nr:MULTISPECIES: TetR/AcrR family transcriptional regulator [Pseudomonas]
MSAARQKLLTTALELFLDEGLQNVGIDRLIKVSGVSKMTLYKYFPSRDNLIVNVLALYHEQIVSEVMQCVADAPPVLEVRFALLLDWYRARFVEPVSRTCLFVIAASAYPDPADPVHQMCLRHKRTLVDLFAAMLANLGYADAPCLALQCLMLFEGARNLAFIGVSGQPLDAATQAMLVLLHQHPPGAAQSLSVASR